MQANISKPERRGEEKGKAGAEKDTKGEVGRRERRRGERRREGRKGREVEK